MRAALQALQLRGVALAAVDRQHVEARHLRRVLLEGLGDLDRELARGREDQRLRGAQFDVDLREDGQREGRRLAGAGLGLAEQVRAPEQGGNGLRLDGRGGFVADVRQSGDDGITQAELGKARQTADSDIYGELMVPGEESGEFCRGDTAIAHFPHPAPLGGARNVREKGDGSIYLSISRRERPAGNK